MADTPRASFRHPATPNDGGTPRASRPGPMLRPPQAAGLDDRAPQEALPACPCERSPAAPRPPQPRVGRAGRSGARADRTRPDAVTWFRRPPQGLADEPPCLGGVLHGLRRSAASPGAMRAVPKGAKPTGAGAGGHGTGTMHEGTDRVPWPPSGKAPAPRDAGPAHNQAPSLARLESSSWWSRRTSPLWCRWR